MNKLDNIKEKLIGIYNKVIKIDKEYLIVIVILASVLIFGIYKTVIQNGGKNTLNIQEEIRDNSNSNKENDSNSKASGIDNKKIYVHIDGAVNSPGVIELNEGDRLNALIEKAGGLTKDANTKSINLATVLTDGSKMYIPFSSEEDTDNNDYTNSETITASKSNEKTTKIQNQDKLKDKVDINRAKVSDLVLINSIRRKYS